jgi:hypothetical protein
LTTSKRAGGWGLRNLSTFNTALLANSFWRAVNLDSIWHRILVEKYMGSLKLVTGFESQLYSKSGPLLSGRDWSPLPLSFFTGSDGSRALALILRLGRDQIMGLDEGSLLPPALCLKLSSLNIFNLAQVRTPTVTPSWPDNWLKSCDLALDGPWALTGIDLLLLLKGLAFPSLMNLTLSCGLEGMLRVSTLLRISMRPSFLTLSRVLSILVPIRFGVGRSL